MFKNTDRIEDTRQPKEIRPSPISCCLACEMSIYAGDKALRDNRWRQVKVHYCMDCFSKANKKDIVELLGGSFEVLE